MQVALFHRGTRGTLRVTLYSGLRRHHKREPEESEALDAGLVEALGVLRVGTDEEHRVALQLVALTALSTPAGAQLWACLLEEAERTIQSVAEYATAVVGAASAIASAQLTAALGL